MFLSHCEKLLQLCYMVCLFLIVLWLVLNPGKSANKEFIIDNLSYIVRFKQALFTHVGSYHVIQSSFPARLI